MASIPLEILLKARDEASAVMSRFKEQTKQVTKSFGALNPAIQGALTLLSAYAGTRGLQAVIRASEQAALSQAQAKFFLRGFIQGSGGVNDATKQIQDYARQLSFTTGVSNNEFLVATAKLANRIKDTNKAIGFTNTLFKLQRLGLLNASDASNLLLRATDGNRRALIFLLEQLGLSVPAFSSLENIMAILEARVKGLTDELNPFAKQWDRIKAIFDDILESAGKPISTFFGDILDGINRILVASPALRNVIGLIIIAGASFLALAGAIFIIKPVIASLFTLVGVGGGIAFGALIATIIFTMFILGEFGVTVKDVMDTFDLALRDPIKFANELFASLVDTFGTGWARIITITSAALFAMFTALALGLGGWIALAAGILGAIVAVVALNWNEIVRIINENSEKIKLGLIVLFSLLRVVFGGGLVLISTMWFDAWEGLRVFFFDVADKIVTKAQEAFQKVSGFLKEALKNVAEIATISPSRIPSIGGLVGGIISGFGKVMGLPLNAEGGIFTRPTPGIIGEAGPEAVIPLNRFGRGFGGLTVVITGNTFMSGEQAAIRIGDMIVGRLKLVSKIGL